ncbi:hypothetical protein MJ561_05380 [Klebsiella pneumoniae]|nr:hypothetical protein MJ561_05380 [Klebsiella pneumoniae]
MFKGERSSRQHQNGFEGRAFRADKNVFETAASDLFFNTHANSLRHECESTTPVTLSYARIRPAQDCDFHFFYAKSYKFTWVNGEKGAYAFPLPALFLTI